MPVLHAHTDGPSGAVYMNVMVQSAPGQSVRVPQTVSLPKSVLLTITSTPAGPLLQVSVPRTSLAPMILEVIVAPG